MKFAVGCDVENVARFAGKTGDDALVKRVYSTAEIQYCMEKSRPEQHFAGKYCAKEAVVKALYGLNIKNVHCDEVEVINNSDGAPVANIQKLKDLKLNVQVSISHSQDTAMAMVVIVADN